MSGGWVVFNSNSSRCSVGGFRVSLMRCVVRTHSSSLPSGRLTRRRLPVAGFFFGVPWATVTSQLVTRRASLSHAASGPRSSTRPLGSCSITGAAWCGQGRLRWLCWPRTPSRLPGRRGSFFSAGAAAWAFIVRMFPLILRLDVEPRAGVLLALLSTVVAAGAGHHAGLHQILSLTILAPAPVRHGGRPRILQFNKRDGRADLLVTVVGVLARICVDVVFGCVG